VSGGVRVPPRRGAGTVAAYDDAAGYGEIVDDEGVRWWFHCTAIADSSRSVPVGAAVRFRLVPGHLGRREAADVEPVEDPASAEQAG
jgi:cold shock CspA family protein